MTHQTRVPPPLIPIFTVASTIVLLATLSLNLPYFALTPGPTQDVGTLIDISDAETTDLDGQLLLTTVSLRSVRVVDAIRASIDPSIDLVSRTVIVPAGRSERDVERRAADQMEESQVAAAAAALRHLGYRVAIEPAGVRINDIASDVPAARVLRPGDVIVGAEGEPVRRETDLIAHIQARDIGEDLRLVLRRDDEEVEVVVQTVPHPDDPERPVVGFLIETVPDVTLPLAVDIESLGIGGPSAGLMFAIGIVDLIDPNNVTGGRIVAGTGTIGIDGRVAAVGGVRQKIEAARRVGADIFLIPTEELAAACDAAGRVTVIAVDRLSDAIAALKDPDVAARRSCPRP